MPPRSVGPYEVLAVIGRGGVGTVYRARHRETGEAVAVKLLGPPPACDPGAARRLAREFEALRALEHPNVVRVFAAGVHEGYSFLAMELVEGLDLRSYLSPALDDGPADALHARRAACEPWANDPATGGALDRSPPSVPAGADAIRAFAAMMDEPETDPIGTLAAGARAGSASPLQPADRIAPAPLEALNRPARLARLADAMRQVCDALAYVHGRGLVHRDLKPSNIMVDDLRRVRIMDFGLVKLATDDVHLTQHGRVVGTYRYMSPEQARGDPVDARSDLYSVGVILFELLCGRPPFVARRAPDLWEEITSRAAPPLLSVNPGAPRALAAVADRLLAKRAAERFQRAEDVLASLP